MTGWDDLARECDAWGGSGRLATWWWRDDDAIDASPALATLLDLQPDALALAVIPDRLEPGLVQSLGRHPGIAVLQHGFAHRNQAPADGRKSEFPDSRDPAAMAVELATGRHRLEAAFGARFQPVMTPPWNRIGDVGIAILKQLGFTGLSRYQPRTGREIQGLRQVNTHVDVIDWAGKHGLRRSFLGEDPCLALFTGHLAARRGGTADADEPTGLLTHHLVHDPATWRFLEKLRDFLAQQPSARLLDPAAVFGPEAISG